MDEWSTRRKLVSKIKALLTPKGNERDIRYVNN